ncbi:MAG: D-2-hydroxyacid dehydrogenase [Deinococcota bacterium]
MNVLVSSVVDTKYVTELVTRFPKYTFTHMESNDVVPANIASVEVFLRCGIPQAQQTRLISQASQLRWIHTCSAGFDYLPLELIFSKGLMLTRSAQTNNVPIAEYVLAHILSFSKRLPTFAAAQAQRVWQRRNNLQELVDKTVGVVGAGSISKALAQRCRTLGMRVIATKRNYEVLSDFDEILPLEQLRSLLAQSDFVVIACPLTSETKGMIGANELEHMKPEAYLINVARGPIVDTAALIDALKAKKLAGAALDVFDEEPLAQDSPLWETPNVILTPHISYVSPHVMSRITAEFADNLARYAKGEPLLNQIKNRELGY